MARDVLHAWVSGVYVGRFERDFDVDKPRFVYADNATAPISLSLPLDRAAKPAAARNFLNGMLPESKVAKDRIRRLTGAPTGETWDLLAAIGGDLPGGVVLHPDSDGPEQEIAFTQIAQSAVVASRIADIKAGGTGYERPDGIAPRFSLAGAQSKFALTRMDGVDFWSDSATPSTHILKPESREHTGLELFEPATLDLARRVGLTAPRADQDQFDDQTTFVIERFDREVLPDGTVFRIHSEDMTQALGTPTEEKYYVDPDEVTSLLRDATGDDELGYDFFRQYIFNSVIGNTDAHGKNYSLLYRDGRVTISPLYDAIPIGMFPDYSQSLAMPVDGIDHFTGVTRENWAASAAEAGLDPDRVLEIVTEVSAGIAESLDCTIGEVPGADQRAVDDIRRVAERNAQSRVTPGGAHRRSIASASASANTQGRQPKGAKVAGKATGGQFSEKKRTSASGSPFFD